MSGSSPEATLYTTPDRTRFFLVPDDAGLPPGEFTIRTFVGRERPGQERSVDPEAMAAYEVGEDEARAWAKEQLGDVLGDVRERVLGFAERLKEKTSELRADNRDTWAGVSDDPELRDATTRIRDGLKDVGRALRRLAQEGGDRAKTKEEPSPPNEG